MELTLPWAEDYRPATCCTRKDQEIAQASWSRKLRRNICLRNTLFGLYTAWTSQKIGNPTCTLCGSGRQTFLENFINTFFSDKTHKTFDSLDIVNKTKTFPAAYVPQQKVFAEQEHVFAHQRSSAEQINLSYITLIPDLVAVLAFQCWTFFERMVTTLQCLASIVLAFFMLLKTICSTSFTEHVCSRRYSSNHYPLARVYTVMTAIPITILIYAIDLYAACSNSTPSTRMSWSWVSDVFCWRIDLPHV